MSYDPVRGKSGETLSYSYANENRGRANEGLFRIRLFALSPESFAIGKSDSIAVRNAEPYTIAVNTAWA